MPIQAYQRREFLHSFVCLVLLVVLRYGSEDAADTDSIHSLRRDGSGNSPL
jgi:hypothetical protein